MGASQYTVTRAATIPAPARTVFDKASNTTTFELEETTGGTHVTWRMVGPKTFATRLMGLFMSMDKMIGRDFEKGLTQLGDAART